MDSNPGRRLFLAAAAASAPALIAATHAIGAANAQSAKPGLQPNSIPVADLPQHYDVGPGIHNLEAGYWSMMPRVVTDVYIQHTLDVNRANSLFARNVLPGATCLVNGSQEAQSAIARQVGCLPEEIGVMRSGSDALQVLISNYRHLKAGRRRDLLRPRLRRDDWRDAMAWHASRRQGSEVCDARARDHRKHPASL